MFAESVVNGLTVGVVYALVALGFTMVFGVLDIINFAHGDVLMIGTFLGLTLIRVAGLPLLPAALLAIVLTAGVGLILERVAFRPLRLAPKWAPLLSSLGASIFLANAGMLLWGPETQPFPARIALVRFDLLGIRVTSLQLWILAACLASMLVLYLVVQRTRIGLAMRATAFSIPLARIMGINVDRVIAFTFALSAGLACVAGILIALYYDAVYAHMGYSLILKAFAATILGGLGSIPGAVVGGIVLGVLENLAGSYISVGYQDAIAFGILLLVLVVRPSGLFGRLYQQKM